jgi:hypothetical protein
MIVWHTLQFVPLIDSFQLVIFSFASVLASASVVAETFIVFVLVNEHPHVLQLILVLSFNAFIFLLLCLRFPYDSYSNT